jgi:tripartite-type tricarboxylate transporter receptor subunit TctC
MRLSKQAVLLAASVLVAAPLTSLQAQESVDTFPSKPFRLMVPYTPGSGTDLAARVAMQGIADRLGKPLVTENKTGATGLIGLNEFLKSAPDGYTVAHVNVAVTFAQAMMPQMNFNLARDVAGIGQYAAQYAVIVSPANLDVKSVAELVALARSKPGALSFGSGGNGTPAHITCELFVRATGIKVVHIPYKGIVNALTDTGRGDLHFTCPVAGNAVPMISAGRIRALAVTNPKRNLALPDVPTITEQGVQGVDLSSWAGLVVPAKTPAPIIAKLNRALRETVADPQVIAFYQKIGLDLVEGDNTPAQFDARMRAESTRWGALTKELGLKAE